MFTTIAVHLGKGLSTQNLESNVHWLTGKHSFLNYKCLVRSTVLWSHSVSYTTFLATNGSDYSGLPMVISFSSGHPLNTPLCANITIIDDDTLENTEALSVSLYTDFPEGVFVSRDRSIVEITDNEEGIISITDY